MVNIEILQSGEVKEGDHVLGCIEGLRFRQAKPFFGKEKNPLENEKTAQEDQSSTASELRQGEVHAPLASAEAPSLALNSQDGEAQAGEEGLTQAHSVETNRAEKTDTACFAAGKSFDRSLCRPLLEKEYHQRAERIVSCANADLCFDTDGYIRWIGQPIATFAAREDILTPGLVLLVDEEVAATDQEKILERVQRFAQFHLETVLKPLYALKNADFLVGETKTIAQKIVEHLGFLPRRHVVEEMRGLDQVSRAALRRLGVRFGAFHLFLPLLLKPHPAQILTFLWGLQNDSRDVPGYKEVPQILLAGRTSVPVDPSYKKQFYTLSGYRLVGQRAVRIDILERLADLIRTVSQWEKGQEQRPDGAYGEKKFYITAPMLSILGATAQDMHDILKNLGYRCEEYSKANFEAHLAQLDKDSAENHGLEVSLPSPEPVGKLAELCGLTTNAPSSIIFEAEPVAFGENFSLSTSENQKESASSSSMQEKSCAHEENARSELKPDEAKASALEELPKLKESKAEIEDDSSIFVWWYQGRRRVEHKRKTHAHKAQAFAGKAAFKKSFATSKDEKSKDEKAGSYQKFDKKQGGAHGHNKGHKAEKYGHKAKSAIQKDKPIDPDSPFAALALLKSKMKS